MLFWGMKSEIFVLKLGFPLACVGLVNADGGVFTQYIGKLFKSMLTVLVQILCCKMGLLLVFSGQLIYAIAMIILAIKTYLNKTAVGRDNLLTAVFDEF